MKRINTIVFFVLTIALLTACIKKEMPNSEADIINIHLDKDILRQQAVIKNDEVICYVKQGVSLRSLAPRFTITEGASISPKSGTVRDFSKPQIYRVSSEDGKWYKDYKVTFIASSIVKLFHFDNAEIKNDRYEELYEVDEKGDKTVIWASGNMGFAITAGDSPASDYPTSITENGYVNKAVKLVTKSTGSLGEMFGSPLAAGNLFMGVFNLDVSSPLKSTRFGVSVNYVPVKMKGYYKYTSGAVYKRYTDENGNKIEGGEVLNRKDSCDIYAVLYETDENTPYLDGTNVLTHPNIISVAQINNINEAEDWTLFDLPFVQKEGKTIEEEKLKNGKYYLTIVFSSSKGGNLYNGAIGSTLLVDELELEIL